MRGFCTEEETGREYIIIDGELDKMVAFDPDQLFMFQVWVKDLVEKKCQ